VETATDQRRRKLGGAQPRAAIVKMESMRRLPRSFYGLTSPAYADRVAALFRHTDDAIVVSAHAGRPIDKRPEDDGYAPFTRDGDRRRSTGA